MFKKICQGIFKRKLYVLVACLCFVIYILLNFRQWNWYLKSSAVVQCVTPEIEMKELQALILDCHEILDNLHLTHVLIYGSLFGAIRYKNVIPWDNDLDMALFAEELKNTDHNNLYKAFKEKDITIIYRPWFGTYRVTRNIARGDLMVFQKTWFGNSYARIGAESWLFYVNHFYYHRFPVELFEKPLPTLQFIGKEMSVPRKGIEIQKYAYPNDWWKEEKPSNCKDTV